MGKTTTVGAPAPQVLANYKGGVLAVAITLDGEPVDGEIQLWQNTPFRATVGGKLTFTYRDPRFFALTAARYEQPKSFVIVARVMVDNAERLSEPVEVSNQ